MFRLLKSEIERVNPLGPIKKSESHSVICDSLQPRGLYSLWNSPGQNPREGGLSLFQGIFPTQGLNPGLLHCGRILYQLSHKGNTVPNWVRNKTFLKYNHRYQYIIPRELIILVFSFQALFLNIKFTHKSLYG